VPPLRRGARGHERPRRAAACGGQRHTFEDVDPALLDRASVSFEGEDTGDRLARRRRNWIPDVVFAAP
jgi:hypothetical protein